MTDLERLLESMGKPGSPKTSELDKTWEGGGYHKGLDPAQQLVSDMAGHLQDYLVGVRNLLSESQITSEPETKTAIQNAEEVKIIQEKHLKELTWPKEKTECEN